MKELSIQDYFSGRDLIIATKHKKESVIAPLLEVSLGVRCFTPVDYDTDLFGTFSGEVAREKDPISTAREKCLIAMDKFGCDLGIASEGSFGAHPSLFFSKADDELLLLIDKKHDFEVLVREVSTETNFNGAEVKSELELIAFLKEVQFPSHGVILRKNAVENEEMFKELRTESDMILTFNSLFSKYGKAYVETDMRAMRNPSRMKVIEKATQMLVARIQNACPNCSLPGFSVVEVKQGLPCQLCASPTNSTLSFVFKCQKCACEHEEMYPNQKTEESPMYCDICNP